MRADRLVSLVLLLRQRGRLSAQVLAQELEVSTRTVLRDIEALSAAGVPVYAERGRHGGFELLPGFRTELTGLTHDEALALLTVGGGRAEGLLGLGTELATALRKVVDALPAGAQATATAATQRVLVEPPTDLLSRPAITEEVPPEVLGPVRRAVLDGRRLRLEYAATGQDPRWRTLDPIGLVTVRGRGYLVATREGAERTYRLSRIRAAQVLGEQAVRSESVDLDQLWRERTARFLSEDHLVVRVRVRPAHREALADHAVAIRAEKAHQDGWVHLELAFQDLWHAQWALWQLGAQAEALGPPELRRALHDRARRLADRYADEQL